KLPFLVHLRPAASLEKIGPGNSALDRPTLVLVGPNIERAAQVDLGLDVEFRLVLEAIEPAGVTIRKKAVEHRAGRVHLEFVIPRLFVGRLEEQFEYVVLP